MVYTCNAAGIDSNARCVLMGGGQGAAGEGAEGAEGAGGAPPTMGAWRRARTASYGVVAHTETPDGDEYEVVNGVKVVHYR